MNQILAETGFSPEWVRLQREIRAEKARVRGELREVRGRLGPPPLLYCTVLYCTGEGEAGPAPAAPRPHAAVDTLLRQAQSEGSGGHQ